MKKAGVVLVVVVLGLLGYFLWPHTSATETVNSDMNIAAGSEPEERAAQDIPDLVIGSPFAPVTITEFADFKCPTCNKFARTTYQEIKKEYIDTNKARLVFRNLPFIATDSRTSAEGAYCANEQGLFSQYHDATYALIWDDYYADGRLGEGESSNVFTVTALSSVAENIGANRGQFEECLNSKRYKQAVESDLRESSLVNATGTPTFIVNEQQFVGAQPFTVFKTLIEAQL